MGTGNNGRVNKQDILAYLKTGRAGASTLKEGLVEQSGSIVPTMSDEIEPMSRMRKKIADHMVQSLQTSAHVYTVVEADVTNMVNIRTENKESFKSKSGVKLTYTPMVLDACTLGREIETLSREKKVQSRDFFGFYNNNNKSKKLNILFL